MSKYGVFSGLYFPVSGLNTEIHGGNLPIQSNTGNCGAEKTLYLGNFHAVHHFFTIKQYLLLEYQSFCTKIIHLDNAA